MDEYPHSLASYMPEILQRHDGIKWFRASSLDYSTGSEIGKQPRICLSLECVLLGMFAQES